MVPPNGWAMMTGGAGVGVPLAEQLQITNNTMIIPDTSTGGGGVFISYAASPVISGNTFSGANSSNNTGVVGIYTSDGVAKAEFRSNSFVSLGMGVGIWLYPNAGTTAISGTNIIGNVFNLPVKRNGVAWGTGINIHDSLVTGTSIGCNNFSGSVTSVVDNGTGTAYPCGH
jgi:hypothetical protein